MKSKYLLRVIALLVLLVSLVPVDSASALFATEVIPPADMFQLPWEQGKSWVALDGFDNGTKRLLNSPHNYLYGGAVDFAPHNGTWSGEDTSNFWVTAAAAGTVIEVGSCHLKINHGNGWTSEYQFLGNIQVKVGDAVYRNQRLAVIADGVRQQFCFPHVGEGFPHLHFSVRPNMRNATFAGWLIQYDPLFNKTTFTKNGQTLGSYQPILNTLDLQIALRDPITWDTIYIGSVDAYRYERWPFVLTESTNFTVTATPTTSGLIPVVLLLDANGNEITRATGTLTSTQPAGNYFVQIQPQEGNGFYDLLLHKNDQPVPTEPYVSTVVVPASINVNETALATVSLNNVPAEGYTSAEFTCTYNASVAEVSNIVTTDLFGADPAVAINGPQDGNFIVAIAGSKGNKATTSGAAFTFDVKGLQAGQTTIECNARVSKGDNTLTSITSVPATLTVLGGTPEPTVAPTPVEFPTPTSTPTPLESPVPTFTSTPEGSLTLTVTATPTPGVDWVGFDNSKYGFRFLYPKEGQIVAGNTDNYARINLPFVQGTNLSQKYLEVIVAENANPCQSPLATSSMLETSETVIINGISFLKETGEDGTAGHINKWVAYSTSRDNACVSLDFVLRAANPGVFTTPPPLYDEAAESLVFGQIVSTYVWLELLPTATPTSTSTPGASPTPTATSTPTPLPTSGILAGQVHASKPVTVSLYAGDTLVTSVAANSDGTFSLSAPAGTYTVIATASGFLQAQGAAMLTAGQTSTMPTISLPAGDIDGNNVIDQFDAMTIGMSYNTAVPAAADLNNDGIINVLDLELLASNYRKSGALAWQ
jgi:murein DD-endopeptidase MepM/ murein hydrolase activator NlpD